MKYRAFAMMAMMFALTDKNAQKVLSETNSYKEALHGSRFQNVNVGNNPIYRQTRSQKIKSKRLAKLNKKK